MKRDKITTFIIATAAMGLSACSSDDATVKTPISATTISVADESSANHLAFSWQPVDNAAEYSFSLKDSEGEFIMGGLTTKTSFEYFALKPATDYVLEVVAYPALQSNMASSEAITLTGRTKDVESNIIQAANNFQLSLTNLMSVDSLTYSIVNNTTSTEVATGVSVVKSDGTFDIQDKVLTTGNFSIVLENIYSGGCSQNCALQVGSVSLPSWSISTGRIYLQGLGKTISNATLTANADGTYTIENWYNGMTEYQNPKTFNFKIDSDGTIIPTNSFSNGDEKYNCDPGRYEEDGDPDFLSFVTVYKSKSHAYGPDMTTVTSQLSLTHGKIQLYIDLTDVDDNLIGKLGDGYYTFSW